MSMKKKVKLKISYIIAILIMLVQFIVLTVFYLFVNSQLTSNIRKNTINSMETTVAERSAIIENYIKEVENYLTAYSRASDIINLLKNPTDAKAYESAQKYTERFSADRDNLEGIYASEWDTHVLTHTNEAVVGITTRTGDTRKALQDALRAAARRCKTRIIICTP